MAFVDGLLPASWRGIPFFVNSISTRVGRRTAIHEYPYRDTIWVEDLGRGVRSFGFRGFVAGPLASVQRDALLLAMERQGAGTLTHPTLGIFSCALVSFSSVEGDDAIGVYTLEMEFLETADVQYPSASADTFSLVDLASLNVLAAGSTMFGAALITAVGFGAAVLSQLNPTLSAWTALPSSLSIDAGAVVGSVTGLGSAFGRYQGGSGSPLAVSGSTPASLLIANNTRQAAVAVAVVAVQTSVPTQNGTTIAVAVQAVAVASKAAAVNPADQVRILSAMATFTPTLSAIGGAVGLAQVALQTATGALCRRASLAYLAQATAAYKPSSYDDAIALRNQSGALFDAEIVIASDAGDTAGGAALRALRSAVFNDLTARGADLAPLQAVRVGASLPAFVLAQLLYQDGSRASELINRVAPVHPGFFPVQFTALAY